MHPAGRFLDSGCGYPRDGPSFQGSSRIANSQANGDPALASRFPLRLQALPDGRRHPTFFLTSACTPTLESSISLTDAVPHGQIWEGQPAQPANPGSVPGGLLHHALILGISEKKPPPSPLCNPSPGESAGPGSSSPSLACTVQGTAHCCSKVGACNTSGEEHNRRARKGSADR